MGSHLDPQDWGAFRSAAHRLLDACIDRLENAGDFPWKQPCQADKEAFKLGEAKQGLGEGALATELLNNVLPFATGNTHPGFFGWVHGTGLATGLMSEIVAATMNSNCGGRNHGATYIEREVIDWCKRCFSLPEQASGLLVTGSSQAAVIALAVARYKALGPESREQGIQNAPLLRCYAVQGVHVAARKALELLGLGSSALCTIPPTPDGGMDLALLARAVERDKLAGLRPFCVIGTAGSVDRGAFDDLQGIADFCQEQQLWFHIDGAFGIWAHLAAPKWRHLVEGAERADSLAFDFHKWMYVQYGCGAVIIRDEALHRGAFATRPDYLTTQQQGLGAGDPWFCDYGFDLSRGFLALKVWSALRAYGSEALGRAITRNCELAAAMEEQVHAASELRMAAPVRLNVCCFSAAPDDLPPADQDDFNAQIVQQLQLAGTVVFSTTTLSGRTVIRAAIVNHRTTLEHITLAITAVRRMREEILGEKQD